MIPVRVAKHYGARHPARIFLPQNLPKPPNASSGINNDHLLVRRQYIQARRITAVFNRLRTRRRNRSSHTPKSYPQKGFLVVITMGISSSSRQKYQGSNISIADYRWIIQKAPDRGSTKDEKLPFPIHKQSLPISFRG